MMVVVGDRSHRAQVRWETRDSGDKQKREMEEKSPWSVKESMSNKNLGRAPGSQSMPPTEASTRCVLQEVTCPVGWQVGWGLARSKAAVWQVCPFSLQCRLGSGPGLSSHMATIIPLWESWERLATHTLAWHVVWDTNSNDCPVAPCSCTLCDVLVGPGDRPLPAHATSRSCQLFFPIITSDQG